MNLTKSVSVVIATFNGEKYILRQLQSILNQSYPATEVLIFDDGSSDDTVKIINNFIIDNQLFGWKCQTNDKNKGYMNNFLSGITKTSGDLIVLSDQDDIWKINKLQVVSSFFENKDNVLAVHTNTTIIDENENPIQKNTQKYTKHFEYCTTERFLKKMNYPGMALVLEGSFARKYSHILMNRDFSIPTHDWTFCAIANALCGFYTSDVVLTYRRYHEDNVALNLNTERLGTLNERITLVNKYKSYYTLYGFLFNSYTEQKNVVAERFLRVTENRLKFLRTPSFYSFFKIFIQFNYYPSMKSLIADLLYGLHLNKIIRRFH